MIITSRMQNMMQIRKKNLFSVTKIFFAQKQKFVTCRALGVESPRGGAIPQGLPILARLSGVGYSLPCHLLSVWGVEYRWHWHYRLMHFHFHLHCAHLYRCPQGCPLNSIDAEPPLRILSVGIVGLFIGGVGAGGGGSVGGVGGMRNSEAIASRTGDGGLDRSGLRPPMVGETVTGVARHG